jgi:hypothetical protein
MKSDHYTSPVSVGLYSGSWCHDDDALWIDWIELSFDSLVDALFNRYCDGENPPGEIAFTKWNSLVSTVRYEPYEIRSIADVCDRENVRAV